MKNTNGSTLKNCRTTITSKRKGDDKITVKNDELQCVGLI